MYNPCLQSLELFPNKLGFNSICSNVPWKEAFMESYPLPPQGNNRKTYFNEIDRSKRIYLPLTLARIFYCSLLERCLFGYANIANDDIFKTE